MQWRLSGRILVSSMAPRGNDNLKISGAKHSSSSLCVGVALRAKTRGIHFFRDVSIEMSTFPLVQPMRSSVHKMVFLRKFYHNVVFQMACAGLRTIIINSSS